jgi:hypothetical protein
VRFHYSTDDLPTGEREPCRREVWSKLVFSVIHDDRPDPGTFHAQIDALIAGSLRQDARPIAGHCAAAGDANTATARDGS